MNNTDENKDARNVLFFLFVDAAGRRCRALDVASTAQCISGK